MRNVRVFFTKHGRMKFASHLDMNRLMTRLIRLSNIPIWYTEGFNQHPYITFALPLSLDHLSERFFISKSHLNRMFKKATGTTAWDYIVVKRLLMARSLLSEGMVPTDVYLKCGFRDYTTFFRAYKKHFGSTPKEYKIR